MDIFRFGSYTIWNGTMVGVYEYYGHGLPPEYDEKRMLRSATVVEGFQLEKDKVYVKHIQTSDLSNAFDVETFGQYKGQNVKVFTQKLDPNLIRISTPKKGVIEKLLDLIKGNKTNTTVIDVPKKEVQKIWEVRSKSVRYDLPFPDSVEEIFWVKK